MTSTILDHAVFGVFSTHALHLADKYGVFVHLAADGPATPARIAEARGIDQDTLERLLLVLTAVSVVERDADGAYRLASGTKDLLDPEHPRYIGDFVRHLVVNTTGQLERLDAYLAVGKAVADRDRPAVFDSIYRDEVATGEFLEAMWNLSFGVSQELVRLAALDDARTLVDVGGASGAFAVAALSHYPRLSVTVFDLPQVGPFLDRTRRAEQLEDRLHFAPGDFFRDPLPEADCLSFGYILSDWDDATCVELLRKAHAACAPGGRVLLMERLFDEDGGPLPTAVMNLSMHVETEGRHRTAAEYTALLEAAGFADCTVHRSSWDKHLVVGRKP
ncbi:methyltransferase [Kitasatospora sp. NPDC058190]|uniref:methyltransferase n=1 Tax=Kitasatospora sp. NPDC058190 TaxID=3346371 RepID=UPI0036DD3C87